MPMIYYGLNPVIESLRSERLPDRIFIQAGKSSDRLELVRRLAAERGVGVDTVHDLTARCQSDTHQGVGARTRALKPGSLDDAIASTDRLIVFDGLQDPHNFGAALRVCEFFGCHHVLYHEGDSSGVTPAAIKVSAGAIFHLHLYLSNLNKAMSRLQEAGFTVYALEAEGATSIRDVQLPARWALVIGSEGRGVRFNIRRATDALVSIPGSGTVNSLNVSCALSAALGILAPNWQK